MRIAYVSVLLLFGYTCSIEAQDLLRFSRQARCVGDQFRCRDGQCVESYSVCDGETNCRDGTDETNAVCSQRNLKCPSHTFRCTYGACIEEYKKCDGKRDCADNSDELLPECKKQEYPVRTLNGIVCKDSEFQCTSAQCIDTFLLCDGNRDCDDGSDETITQCVSFKCPDHSFQCAYGACIDQNKKCNNVEDCSDASDEVEELCHYKRRPSYSTIRPPTTTLSGGCILPEYPDGGRYVVQSCPSNRGTCSGTPGRFVPLSSVLRYTCSDGYTLSDNGKNIYCYNGTWDPQPLQCLKQCKALVSDSTDLKCFYRGERVECDRPLHPGTKILPRCKVAYHVADPSVSFFETVCLGDGTLETPLFRCVADCGKPIPNSERPAISFGDETSVEEYPWHAGLYRKTDGVWEYVCGGTIISPYVVLTAAHCVYAENIEKVLNASDFAVAVGKYNRTWNENEKRQILNVKEIIPQRAYKGKSNNYEQDIAVLDLEKSIMISALVLPACVDWQSEGTFFPLGSLGTVVGWGRDENGVPTRTLEVVRLPYYDYEFCREMSSTNFLQFITYDKFCAGYFNGTGVQPGDSGGGYTFVRNNLHYVYGVVSLKQRGEDTFSAFTNVTEHIHWLSRVFQALKPLHAN